VPHLSPVFRLAQSLGLRAAVAGLSGDVPKAVESLRILDRLARASFEEPLLINALVAGAMEILSVHAVWELGCAQQGTAEEWKQLEQLTAALDLRAAFLRSYRGEAAAGIDSILFARDTRRPSSLVGLLPGMHDFPPEPKDTAEHAAVLAMNLAPPGFFDSVATEFGSMQLSYVLRPLRVEGWPGSLKKQHLLEASLNEPAPTWNIPALIMRPEMGTFAHTILTFVYLQVGVDQATIACVLERARLAGGAYPASLDGLTLADGRPLPLDACTGRPMHYRPTPEGRYLLWSEGPDGRDDGATRGSGTALPSTSDYKGDWVWGYPAPR
jgi:hypothetical protein